MTPETNTDERFYVPQGWVPENEVFPHRFDTEERDLNPFNPWVVREKQITNCINMSPHFVQGVNVLVGRAVEVSPDITISIE